MVSETKRVGCDRNAHLSVRTERHGLTWTSIYFGATTARGSLRGNRYGQCHEYHSHQHHEHDHRPHHNSGGHTCMDV